MAGAGQSNLSTGVAALIQDQMVTSPHSPRVRSFSPSEDFIEMDFDPGSNVVDVYVRYLRGKLGAHHIATVRGAGYRWE